MNTRKAAKYTHKDFQKEFPDNDACLEWLKNYRYPEGIHCPVCDKITKHHKIAKRPCYKCDNCGHEIYPLAGTIFHKSATPLKTWLEAMYWMSTARSGRSAKELQRMTGVTYKTAWRMFKQIRSLLDEETQPLAGEVELDETFVGGKAHNMHKANRERLGGRGTAGKAVIFGAVERKGKVVAKKVANTDKGTLMPHITKNVSTGAIVY